MSASRPWESIGSRCSWPVWIYEGALLLVTENFLNYSDSPYKGDWRGTMTEGPRLSRPLKHESSGIHLGFRRSVASEREVPNMLASPVWSE
jgi:hypothetical protein